MASGRLHAEAGGDAGEHHLGDAKSSQPRLEVGVGEGAPRLLGHQQVTRLRVQLGREIGPIRRQAFEAVALFGPARRDASDIDQHHRQASALERGGQSRGGGQDAGDGMGGGEADDALLQVDDDERGLRVEGGDGHG